MVSLKDWLSEYKKRKLGGNLPSFFSAHSFRLWLLSSEPDRVNQTPLRETEKVSIDIANAIARYYAEFIALLQRLIQKCGEFDENLSHIFRIFMK